MAEALNFSGVDLKLFFDANTAAAISIFTFLVIPPFLLVLAKDINAKIHFLLINIITAEMLSGFSFFSCIWDDQLDSSMKKVLHAKCC